MSPVPRTCTRACAHRPSATGRAGPHRRRHALVAPVVAALLVMGVAAVASASPAGAATGQAYLASGESLTPGQKLVSANGAYQLQLQTDGNLVLTGRGKVLWNIGVTAGRRLLMQTDGNLVLTTPAPDNDVVWHSHTWGNAGARLDLRDDGNAVISRNGGVLWESGTAAPRTGLRSGERLLPNQTLQSSNEDHGLWMMPNGNLVLFGPDGYRWASGTTGTGNSAIMQTDGNLVVDDASGRALWSTKTWGNNGARLSLQDDGNLVIYSTANAAIWNAGVFIYHDLEPGGDLRANEQLRSRNGKHSVVMMPDGNLVIFGPSGYRWATSTQGAGNRAVLQADGNFVVYSTAGRALWSTNTAGNAGTHLQMQDDGNLVLYSSGWQPLWNTGGYVPPAPPSDCSTVTASVAIGETTVVAGIRVHKCLATKLQAMLSAASADGVPLDAWGWRSYEKQVELRRDHCGPTHYDIYEKPSSQCNPPTAKPGTSQHERGLAIDIKNCASHNLACFRWLDANASRFGFFNLPSEPWHWSTTGR